MTENRVVSITSTEMDTQVPTGIPDEIYEYRSLTKEDLTSKLIEARDEMAGLTGVSYNKTEYISKILITDHNAKAVQLYSFRNTIKDLKEMIDKKVVDVVVEEPKFNYVKPDYIETIKEQVGKARTLEVHHLLGKESNNKSGKPILGKESNNKSGKPGRPKKEVEES